MICGAVSCVWGSYRLESCACCVMAPFVNHIITSDFSTAFVHQLTSLPSLHLWRTGIHCWLDLLLDQCIFWYSTCFITLEVLLHMLKSTSNCGEFMKNEGPWLQLHCNWMCIIIRVFVMWGGGHRTERQTRRVAVASSEWTEHGVKSWGWTQPSGSADEVPAYKSVGLGRGTFSVVQ